MKVSPAKVDAVFNEPDARPSGLPGTIAVSLPHNPPPPHREQKHLSIIETITWPTIPRLATQGPVNRSNGYLRERIKAINRKQRRLFQ